MSAGARPRPDAEGRAAPSRWRRINWINSAALIGIHAGSLLVLWTGISRPAAIAALVVYWTEIFGVSAGYHRYFAHHSFRTSRGFQFALAFLGGTAAQMGPLWWSSYHRRHHADADGPGDVHSPRQDGLLWAHVGWVLDANSAGMDPNYVRDWLRYPELRWLDRLRWIPPLTVIVALAALGGWLAWLAPGSGTGPLQMVAWGFFLPTTICYQVTFSVNSIAHRFGRRRFDTADDSRNVAWIALMTNGEGWHNNHHRFPSSEKHGFAWWELDVTHAVLRGLEAFGVVWALKTQPAPAIPAGRAS
jgi:stearoyl-CoA desaturase (delta-9 desaturase)